MAEAEHPPAEMKIRLRDGTPRTFVTPTRLREVLDLPDEASYRRGRDLLIEDGLLAPHRRSGGAKGFILADGWEEFHVLHLRRLVKLLLQEDGFTTDSGGRIRIVAL